MGQLTQLCDDWTLLRRYLGSNSVAGLGSNSVAGPGSNSVAGLGSTSVAESALNSVPHIITLMLSEEWKNIFGWARKHSAWVSRFVQAIK